MKLTQPKLRQMIREAIADYNQQTQLEDDLILAYKWAFGKVWEKAKRLSPQDPEHKRLLTKMADLGKEIEKLVKRQHGRKNN